MPTKPERNDQRMHRSGTGGRGASHNLCSRSKVQLAKATLRPLRFTFGKRAGPVEISPRLTSAERAAVEFWIRRMQETFANRLHFSRRGPLKIAVANHLISIGGKVFINQELPKVIATVANKKHSQRFSKPHAVSYIPERYVVLERALFRRRIEHGRILYHELCHFVWPRLGNRRRRRFQHLIRRELREHIRGELGYSSEIRKTSLITARRNEISRRALARQQSDYFCECFCDTGAYVLLGSERRTKHSEFTLSRAARERRVCAWEAAALSGD